MKDDFVTNLILYILTLSANLNVFKQLSAHCPSPDNEVNDFLYHHLASSVKFTRNELILACLFLAKEYKDE